MTKVKETKSERFLRLVQSRVPKALEAIRLIGQLGSSNYESTTDEVSEINDVLTDSLDTAMLELGYVKAPQPTATAANTPTGYEAPDPVKSEIITTPTGPEWAMIGEALEALNEGHTEVAKAKLLEALSN